MQKQYRVATTYTEDGEVSSADGMGTRSCVTYRYRIYTHDQTCVFDTLNEAEAKAKHAELVSSVKRGREDGITVLAENLVTSRRGRNGKTYTRTFKRIYGCVDENGVTVCHDTDSSRWLKWMEWRDVEAELREFPEVIAKIKEFLG